MLERRTLNIDRNIYGTAVGMYLKKKFAYIKIVIVPGTTKLWKYSTVVTHGD